MEVFLFDDYILFSYYKCLRKEFLKKVSLEFIDLDCISIIKGR